MGKTIRYTLYHIGQIKDLFFIEITLMQKNLERLKLRKIEPGPFYLKQKSFIF